MAISRSSSMPPTARPRTGRDAFDHADLDSLITGMPWGARRQRRHSRPPASRAHTRTSTGLSRAANIRRTLSPLMTTTAIPGPRRRTSASMTNRRASRCGRRCAAGGCATSSRVAGAPRVGRPVRTLGGTLGRPRDHALRPSGRGRHRRLMNRSRRAWGFSDGRNARSTAPAICHGTSTIRASPPMHVARRHPLGGKLPGESHGLEGRHAHALAVDGIEAAQAVADHHQVVREPGPFVVAARARREAEGDRGVDRFGDPDQRGDVFRSDRFGEPVEVLDTGRRMVPAQDRSRSASTPRPPGGPTPPRGDGEGSGPAAARPGPHRARRAAGGSAAWCNRGRRGAAPPPAEGTRCRTTRPVPGIPARWRRRPGRRREAPRRCHRLAGALRHR